MKTYKTTSGNDIIYVDYTDTSNGSFADDSSASPGNLSSISKNNFIVTNIINVQTDEQEEPSYTQTPSSPT